MELEQAIRTRRTHKAYRPQPLDHEILAELFELANWAPNHHLTQPWRFRVVGPEALERLKAAAGPDAAPKLDRAPTLVACSAVRTPGDERADEEDLLASACAAYVVLLAAHGRGLAGYWRTPAVLWQPEGLAALGIPPEERAIGLLYLGRPIQEQRPPARAPAMDAVRWLD